MIIMAVSTPNPMGSWFFFFFLGREPPEPELRRILAEHRVTLPKAVECGFSRIFEEPAPDGGEPGLVYRYDRLRESLWELLQLVIADPVRTPETRLIPVPVIGPDGELLTAATNSQPRN